MAKKQEFTVGLLVEHPQRPQWGPGRIVAVAEDRIHLFFRDDLEEKAKVILTEFVALRVLAEQTDSVLDSLPPAKFDGRDWILPKTKRATADAKKKARAAALAQG